MPSITATVTATTEIKLNPKLKKRLLTELKGYAALKVQRDAIDHAMTKHREGIEGVLDELGESSIAIEGYKSTLVAPVRKKLDPKRLVALGVSTDVIAKATTETPGKPYVKVTVPGEKTEEDDV